MAKKPGRIQRTGQQPRRNSSAGQARLQLPAGQRRAFVRQNGVAPIQQAVVNSRGPGEADGPGVDGRLSALLVGILGNNVQVLILILITAALAGGVGQCLAAPASRQEPPVAASSPTPVATATAMILPAPTPTSEPKAIIVGEPNVECHPVSGPKYVEVRFRVTDLAKGSKLRVFARSSGNPKYYPSHSPTAYIGGIYSAVVYIGMAQQYSLHVFALAGDSDNDVASYINARELDDQWGQGMQLPQGVMGILDRTGVQGCLVATRSPVPSRP